MEKFLKYNKPLNLYARVQSARQKLMTLDTGSTGVGICVIDPTNALPFPVPVLNSCEENFLLSPLETALQQMDLNDKLLNQVVINKMLFKERPLSLYGSSLKDRSLIEKSMNVYSTLHEILSKEFNGCYTWSFNEMDLKDKVMKALTLKGCSGLYLYPSLIDAALEDLNGAQEDLKADSSLPAGSFVKGGMFVLDRLVPLQVIKPEDMSPAGIRNVMNSLTELHNVGGWLFSYSADSRHWNEEEKYKFTTKLLSDLEDDGGLSQRNFSFADEVDTTHYANLDVSRLYPQLCHWQSFLNEYPDMRSLKVYHDRQKLAKDLRDFRKGIVDNYSARNCLSKFWGKCTCKKLYSNKVNTEKQDKMVEFAARLGYVDPN